MCAPYLQLSHSQKHFSSIKCLLIIYFLLNLVYPAKDEFDFRSLINFNLFHFLVRIHNGFIYECYMHSYWIIIKPVLQYNHIYCYFYSLYFGRIIPAYSNKRTYPSSLILQIVIHILSHIYVFRGSGRMNRLEREIVLSLIAKSFVFYDDYICPWILSCFYSFAWRECHFPISTWKFMRTDLPVYFCNLVASLFLSTTVRWIYCLGSVGEQKLPAQDVSLVWGLF